MLILVILTSIANGMGISLLSLATTGHHRHGKKANTIVRIRMYKRQDTRLKWIELMGKIISKGQVRCTVIIYEATMKTMDHSNLQQLNT